MSGSRAKAIRRERREAGLPDNGRTEGPNLVDLEDTREQRRTKRFRKDFLAAQMRETDPKTHRKRIALWNWVSTWLQHPMYRDALGDPHRGRRLKGE